MQSSKPALDVWDSCCLIGILNGETDKVPALLGQVRLFESGGAVLGIPMSAVTEVVSLSDGTPAEEKVKAFLRNPYVILLQSNLEVCFRSNNLQFRFDSKRMPDLKAKAIAAGVPKDRANRLTPKDSEILATAVEYKAARLTTYDPFLLFIGREYIRPETGLIVDLPDSSWLPFPKEPEKK